MNDASRREFLKAATAGLAVGLGSSVLAAQEESPDGIPTRPLGGTGERVSMVGLGGFHVGTLPDDEAIAIMQEAVDEGMTFFDTAWDYQMGGSETKMGKALVTGGRRDKVFLMTKNCGRDYKESKQHLEDSLRRLQTDRIDLWQFHEINYADAPDMIFDRGALKAAVEAKKEGKVRYIGFTGHKDPKYLLKMLDKPFERDRPFEWDTVQMPVSVLDAHYRSFQKLVLPVCNQRKIGTIGMKSLAGGFLPGLGFDAVAARRYALSLPISTLSCGLSSRKDLQQDLALARNFKPMTEAELREMLAKSKDPGHDGRHETFKTTNKWDSPYHRRQHGA